MTGMLELQGLSKQLGEFCMRGLNLSLERGEYFVLLGPSGMGKTVLLELIAGLQYPDAGRILFDGVEINTLPPERRGFALVYQNYALFPHLTVRDNIGYGLRMRKDKKEDAAQVVGETAERLGITPLLSRRPATLSGGEQQRVALARALVTRPPLMLLDEPLSSLDTGMRLDLRRELKRIQQESGATFLHVTHDPEEALHLADRVGVMVGGSLQQVDTPEKLFRHPSDPMVGAFLGMVNFLPITSVRGQICLVGGVELHVAHASPEVCYLWIKPEEIILSGEPFSSSARNQFPGTVTDVEPAGLLYTVTVAIGSVQLMVLVTHESLRKMELSSGRQVYCTFKSSAIHCF
jgi:molybdate/tungstate transport system ATP-binding protein